MKTKLAGILVIAAAFGGMAGTSGSATAPGKQAYDPVAARELVKKAYGGFVIMPGSQKGSIRIVNVQKVVPEKDLEHVLEFFRGTYDYDVKIVSGEGVTPSTAVAKRNECKADLAIFVVYDPEGTALLTAPEDRWAFVNVAKLEKGARSLAYTAARTRKSILRALAYLTAGSQGDAPLVDAMKDPSDFDVIARPAFTSDVMARTVKYLKKLGITPKQKTTYRNALEQGANIAPTNEFQKAIWDKVHAPPSKPIKITYDKDKQKPVVK